MLDQDIMPACNLKLIFGLLMTGRLTKAREPQDQTLLTAMGKSIPPLNSHAIAPCKTETPKQENLVKLYQNAIKHDQLQGLRRV